MYNITQSHLIIIVTDYIMEMVLKNIEKKFEMPGLPNRDELKRGIHTSKVIDPDEVSKITFQRYGFYPPNI